MFFPPLEKHKLFLWQNVSGAKKFAKHESIWRYIVSKRQIPPRFEFMVSLSISYVLRG